MIPAYNAAPTVQASITSALSQTVSDLEVIVVDDGSIDDTVDVARSVDDARVRVLTQQNAGAAAARNTGISAAGGRYVGLLDSDDLWVPWKLERQLGLLKSDSTVHAVQSGAYFVGPDLRLISVRPCRESKDPLLDTLLFRNMPNSMSTLLIERLLLDQIGPFDTRYVILEEWDMAIRLARHGNLASVSEPLSLYRVHPGNRSRNVDIHIRPGHEILEALFADPYLPSRIVASRSKVYGHFFAMLSGGAFRVGRLGEAVRWGAKGIRLHPAVLGYALELPARRVRRRVTRVARRSRDYDDRGYRAAVAAVGQRELPTEVSRDGNQHDGDLA